MYENVTLSSLLSVAGGYLVFMLRGGSNTGTCLNALLCFSLHYTLSTRGYAIGMTDTATKLGNVSMWFR